MNSSKQQLEKIMESHPQLTDFGFGIYRSYYKLPPDEFKEKFEEEREMLAQSVDEFERACQWISDNLYPIQSMNRNQGSYAMKHTAEKEIDYITNGVFIAAMLANGYDFERTGANAFFNVSARAYNETRKRIYGF